MRKKIKVYSLILTLLIVLNQMQVFAKIINPEIVKTDYGSFCLAVYKEDELQGFKKIKTEFISDYQTNAYTYEHIKTGAKVLVINNADEEKFFTIGFKTPPSDNSGATHVFEHTTLQGSKNYPVKSMLSRLGSSTMATYFNAATADDFTFYPFGSLNEKDYYNLMNIYLDGVFHPLVMTDENVFKRDGVRIDLKDNILSFNGVVFNEMKNSSANINAILYNSIKQSLYPDTYYKYVSGGLPENIPDLTYESILKLHDIAYHPSNSLTILYGNQDLEKSLSILNNYFKEYDKQTDTIEIGYQQPFKSLQKYYTTYPMSNESNKSIMALSYVIPDDDYEQLIIDLILIDLLMLGDTAPLKKAIAETGITNSLGATSNYMQINQGAISFYSLNIDKEYEDTFVNVIENSLKKIKETGFDEDYIKAVFNACKYNQLTALTGKSVGYNAAISAISGWLYHDNPTLMLDNKAIYSKIEKNLNSKMFEDAIDRLFLKNNFKALSVIEPDKDYNLKRSNILNQKLNNYISNLTVNQKAELEKQTEKFYTWQNSQDSIEALETLPSLDVKDISTQKKVVEISEPININNTEFIQTYINTNGISNIILSFDASTISQSKLQYLQLMSSLLSNVATKNYNKYNLALQKFNYLGDFNVDLTALDKQKENSYTPRFNISFKSLEQNEKEAINLVNEIINNSNFEDKQAVIKALQQIKFYYEQSLSELSVPITNTLAQAMTSERGKLEDYVKGYEFYKFVVNLLNNIDKDWKSILKQLQEVKQIIFNKNNLVIGYTNTKDKQKQFIKNIKPLIDSLSDKKYKQQKLKFRQYGNIIGVVSPSTTLSIKQIGNLKDLGYEYNGNMAVLSTIVSKGYLWEYIREQGGAYHTALNISSDGLIQLLSYADPNFKQTIKVYQNVPLFLKNINSLEQNSINNFIIKDASNIDNSLQEYNLWNYGLSNYITGYNLENIYKYKQDILNTKVKDISSYSDLFEKLNSKAKYIIVGNKKTIYENEKIFDEIIDLK